MHFIRTLSLALGASMCTTAAAAPLARRDILANIARRAPDPQNDSTECDEIAGELAAMIYIMTGERIMDADENAAYNGRFSYAELAEGLAAIANETCD
ncbi:hypothetical protein FQN54_003338 [Arachnomyces sp. PD_36]|nr:hypothetical protein FQN54_003338 [Arachnomyces sp. PD_36]